MDNDLSRDLFWQSAQKKMSEHALKHGHALEYLEGALQFLIDFLRCPLSAEEKEKYTTRLATYPKMKLEMLSEYTGHISGIWKYLDEVRTDAETRNARAEVGEYKQLPYNPQKEIARDVLKHVFQMMDEKDVARCDELERVNIAALRQKYPHVKWMCGRSANKGK